MAFNLPTNLSTVEAWAGALYGYSIGSTTMAQVNADIVSYGGLNNTLNAYYSAAFGSQTTATVAKIIVANVGLGTDANAIAYVTGQLNAATPATRGAAVANILNAFAALTADPTYGAAATAWNTTVANSVTYEASNTADSTTTAAASANSAAAAAAAAAATAGQTVSLTTSADIINTGNNNDTFIATDTTLTPGDTVNANAGSDIFNFYQVSTQTGNVSYGPALTLTGIETLNVFDAAVNASTSKAVTFDISAVGGLTSVNVNNTATLGTVTIDKLSKSIVAGLTGQQAGAETFKYNGVAATDTIKLALTGVYGSSSTTNATLTLTTGTGAATTDVSPTLLSISGTGGKVLLVDNSLTTITSTTTGTSTLALDGTTSTAYPTIRTIDFSASTGTNTIDLATGGGTAAANYGVAFNTAGFTFKGGSGKDTLRVTLTEASNYASTWSMDGGAGTDTLAVYSPLAATSNTAYGAAQTLTSTQISFVNKLANFETLQLVDRDTGTLATGNNAAGWSVAVDGITSVTDFSFSSSFSTAATSGANAIVGNKGVDSSTAGVTPAPAISITGQTNVDTFTFAGNITGGLGATTSSSTTTAATPAAALSISPTLDNGANTLSITLSAATITGGAAAKATVAGANAFTATSFETINLSSSATGTNVTIANGGSYTNSFAGGAGNTTGANGYGLALGSNTVVNISGAFNIDMGTVSGTNETINASTLSGDFKFVEAGTASNLTIIGGTGANNITVLTGVNTIDISGATANKDTVKVTGDNGPTLASSLSTASVTQVKGFTNVTTNGDLLDINDTTLQANATASAVTTGTYSSGVSFTAAVSNGILSLTATGTAKFNDYLTAAENVLGAAAVGAFEYSGNTFVVDHTTTGYQVIELVGLTGVTALSATASGATTILIG